MLNEFDNGSELTIGVRPEHVSVMHRSDHQPSAKGLAISGKIFITEPMGFENVVHVQVDGMMLKAITPATMNFDTNENVLVRFNEDHIHVFGKKGDGRALI